MKQIKTVTIISILIIILGLLILIKQSTPHIKPEVNSSYPKNNQVNVKTNQSIKIIFQEPVTAADKFSFTSQPQINFTQAWNGDQLILTPKDEMPKSTTIIISLNFRKEPIYQLTFKTSEFSLQDLKQQSITQIQDDITYNQQRSKTLKETPWLTLLPIETDNYRAVYDYSQQKIRIRLKIKPSPAQETSFTQSIIKELESKNIPATISGYIILNSD